MANVICWPTQLTNMPPGVSVFFFSTVLFFLPPRVLSDEEETNNTWRGSRHVSPNKIHLFRETALVHTDCWDTDQLFLHKMKREHTMPAAQTSPTLRDEKDEKKKTTKKIECHWKTKATFNAEWLRWTTRLGECLSLPPPFQHENTASGVNALGKRSEQKTGNTATPPLYSTHFVWTIRWFISFQIIRVVATIFRLVFSFLYTHF